MVQFSNELGNLIFECSKKTGIRGCVGKRFIFHKFVIWDSGASSVVVLESCMYRGQGGGIIYRETGLKVSIVITIGEAFNWVWFNLNEEREKSLRE